VIVTCRATLAALCLFLATFAVLLGEVNAQQVSGKVNGNATIRAPLGESEIVIRTTSRLAGAIDSLTWNGQEFIDSTDHGRQLQSASNFDLNTSFSGETFNPTEAGSRNDGAGPNSTSRLLHLVAKGNQLQTTSQMAFWLRPGEKSGGKPAKNTTEISNHLLTKRVTIGWQDMPNVITHNVTFGVPIGERHTYAQFEAVTGYMPAVFSRFWSFNSETGQLDPLSDGPGEQPHPVILATESGSHAMGIFSPNQPSPGFRNAGYGRWRFRAQKVVKWNSVFRVRSQDPVSSGDYSFRNFVVVGDLKMVHQTIGKLTKIRHERHPTGRVDD
jgi:hypothetical protein